MTSCSCSHLANNITYATIRIVKHIQDRVNHDHSCSCFAPLCSGLGKYTSRGNDVGRVTDLDIGTDYPQAERAHEGREDRRIAAAPDIDQEHVEDNRCDG